MTHPLKHWLDIAVPLALFELKERGGPTDEDIEEARKFVDELAEHGDMLLFVPDGAGKLASKLARAIAVLAYQPGGIRVFDRHWKAL